MFQQSTEKSVEVKENISKSLNSFEEKK